MCLLFPKLCNRVLSLQVRIMRNKDTGESKGFAFVAFTTKDEAQKAIEELHSKEFKVISAFPHLASFILDFSITVSSLLV